jgi:cation:H+ antiporter
MLSVIDIECRNLRRRPNMARAFWYGFHILCCLRWHRRIIGRACAYRLGTVLGGKAMRIAVLMILALLMVLFGAELFTNAVEWLGVKLKLGQGAVGSVLAALGTALPETAVPVTAILLGRGNHASEEVGIGGILGAPFLLVTLGSLILALSLLLTRGKVRNPMQLMVQKQSFHRDMSFFLMAYSGVLVIGIIRSPWLHTTAPFVLLALYGLFVWRTVRGASSSVAEDLHPLYVQWKAESPSAAAVGVQLAASLLAIVGGAHLLSKGVEQIASLWNLPPFVLSAILIPLVTELPETLNSVVWIRQEKDALALGNITGAMVFQSTIVPALGIWLTPWQLNGQALLTGGLTLAAGALIFGFFRLRHQLVPGILIAASLLYWLLPLQTVASRYDVVEAWWISGVLIVTCFFLSFQISRRVRSV